MIEQLVTFSLVHKPAYDDILDCLADLHELSFRAPEVIEIDEPQDTYDAYYGRLEDLDEIHDDALSCASVGMGINEELGRWSA